MRAADYLVQNACEPNDPKSCLIEFELSYKFNLDVPKMDI